MAPIVFLSTVIHILVVLRGIKFFLHWSDSRDDDRTIVVSVLAMSVLFILAQAYTLAADPAAIFAGDHGLRVGFDVASGLIFLAVVHYADNACDRREHP